MNGRPDCPACGSACLSEIYSLDPIPVQSCVLLDSRAEALAFPKAPLLLKACDACGFLFNALFDPCLVDYASATEESQHFSDTFNRFAERLVEEIAERHDLSGRLTLEIGCGKGDFLQALAEATGARGIGVDPGFTPERHAGRDGVDIAFRREYFDPKAIAAAPDFIVCRHTLEHISEVARFLSDITAVIGGRSGVGVFFETPDVERVLAEGAFWDIYYEHCSYFTRGSHARLFRQAGLRVTRLRLAYDDQYIIQFAEPGRENASFAEEQDLDRTRALTRTFPARVAERRGFWGDLVRRRHADGERVAVWGGGSKAVSFLTTLRLGEEIGPVVDVNPHKQGRFLPGTGHEVVAPTALKSTPPEVVIAMNPIYRREIAADLAAMRLAPELLAV